MHGDRFTMDDDYDIIPYDDDADDDKPIKIQTAQRKMNAILAGWTTASSIIEFIDHTPSTNMKHSFFQKIPIPNTIIPLAPSPVPT